MTRVAGALLLALALAACTVATPTPVVTQPGGPSPSPSSVAVPTSAAVVPDSAGSATFLRPAGWNDYVPTNGAIPGVIKVVTSFALVAGCDVAVPVLPRSCFPGGSLPDAGVVIWFSSGGVLVTVAATPLPASSVRDDACAAIGGHALATRVNTTWIHACLRDSVADGALATVFASMR